MQLPGLTPWAFHKNLRNGVLLVEKRWVVGKFPCGLQGTHKPQFQTLNTFDVSNWPRYSVNICVWEGGGVGGPKIIYYLPCSLPGN